MTLLAAFLALYLVGKQQSAAKLIVLVPEEPPTVEQVQQVRTTLAGSGIDGLVVRIRPENGGERPSPSNLLASGDPWNWSDFQRAVATLKRHATDVPSPASKLFLEVQFGKGQLDFFDDLSWSELESRCAIVARVCRESGVAGVYLKLSPAESLNLPAFTLFQQPHWADHKRIEFTQIARRRGKQILSAMVHEDLKLVILLPDFLGILTQCYDSFGKPALSPGDNGDLLPAFASGMLEGINGTTDLEVASSVAVPGNRGNMLSAVQRCSAFDQQLVDPDVQDRYRTRVHPAIVLDSLRKDELANALAVTSLYVLLQTNKAVNDRAVADAIKPTLAERQTRSAVSGAFTPMNLSMLSRTLSTEPNRILNGDVVGKIGWDSSVPYGDGQANFDPTKGNNRSGSLHLRGVPIGTWFQEVPVNAGSSYAVRAFCQTNGVAKARLEINWKDREGRGLLPPTGFLPADGSGWQPILGQIRAPEGAVRMAVKLTLLSPGGLGDEAWFDDVKVVEL